MPALLDGEICYLDGEICYLDETEISLGDGGWIKGIASRGGGRGRHIHRDRFVEQYREIFDILRVERAGKPAPRDAPGEASGQRPSPKRAVATLEAAANAYSANKQDFIRSYALDESFHRLGAAMEEVERSRKAQILLEKAIGRAAARAEDDAEDEDIMILAMKGWL